MCYCSFESLFFSTLQHHRKITPLHQTPLKYEMPYSGKNIHLSLSESHHLDNCCCYRRFRHTFAGLLCCRVQQQEQ